MLSFVVNSPLATTPHCFSDSFNNIFIAYAVCIVYEMDPKAPNVIIVPILFIINICCFQSSNFSTV